MKLILEGSPTDIKEVINNNDICYNAAKSEIVSEQSKESLQKSKKKFDAVVKDLIDKNENLSKQIGASQQEHAELIELRQQIGAHKAALATAESKIASLKNELANPIRLSTEQEAQIEKAFQEQLEAYKVEPLVFYNSTEKKEITAKQIFQTVFGFLAVGKRLHAVKALREVTGMALLDAKNLIDNAMVKNSPSLETTNKLLQIEEKT